LVVGAGIGGLAAALALRRAGWDVRVFERATSPRELGFALLLAPNAMHALNAIGLADVARHGGYVASDGEMRRPNGTVLRQFNAADARAQLGEDTVCILRPVLHGALLEAVGHDALALASDVTGFTLSGSGVEVTLSNGTSAGGDVLIGADGVASRIRRQLHPAEDAPRRSGLIAVRGVAANVVSHLGGKSGAQYFGRGLEAGVARAGERDVYWYLSLRADMVSAKARPQAIAGGVASRFHTPFRAIVHATQPDDLRLDELFESRSDCHLGLRTGNPSGRRRAPDAPHAGQGAAQALEDAATLGRVLSDGANVTAALRRYEQVRAARTRAIVMLARRNARMGSIRSAAGCWVRDQIIRFVPQSVI
jgi:2-polyprenyl-6-methoxyphenol hydroxylase-like FAD-dependent oxidoreductase